jgi:putative tryptophan/tyrosine transport system substrate-binding protein
MRRREFITLVAGATAAWPLTARTQQNSKPVRLGLVPLGSPENTYDLSLVEAFRQGLRKVGLLENQNVILDVAWVKNDPDEAVNDVLQRGAQVLIPCGSSASAAAQRRTSTVPIVFLSVGEHRACRQPGASGTECDRIQ